MPLSQAIFSFLAAAMALVLLIAWLAAPYKDENKGLRPPLKLLAGAMLAFAAMSMMITD